MRPIALQWAFVRGELAGAVGCEKNRNALGPSDGKIRGCPVITAAAPMIPIAIATPMNANTDLASSWGKRVSRYQG